MDNFREVTRFFSVHQSTIIIFFVQWFLIFKLLFAQLFNTPKLHVLNCFALNILFINPLFKKSNIKSNIVFLLPKRLEVLLAHKDSYGYQCDIA